MGASIKKDFSCQLRAVTDQLLSLLAEFGRGDDALLASSQRGMIAGGEFLLWSAERLYAQRSLRESYLPSEIFGEPAWDMLLDLYINDKRNRPVSVTSACIASRVPPTTALRWLTLLEESELVFRTADRIDRRRCYVRLTQKGFDAMNRFFATEPTCRRGSPKQIGEFDGPGGERRTLRKAVSGLGAGYRPKAR